MVCMVVWSCVQQPADYRASTWDTLHHVGHHGAEVGPDVLQDLCVFVVLCLQQHAGHVHVLQEQGAQGQAVPLQRPAGAVSKQTSLCEEHCGGGGPRPGGPRGGGAGGGTGGGTGLPVTDDAGVCQQLKDPQQLQSQQVSPLPPLLVLGQRDGMLYITSHSSPNQRNSFEPAIHLPTNLNNQSTTSHTNIYQPRSAPTNTLAKPASQLTSQSANQQVSQSAIQTTSQ